MSTYVKYPSPHLHFGPILRCAYSVYSIHDGSKPNLTGYIQTIWTGKLNQKNYANVVYR
jgi:hypothetical protein